ncbi:MAG: branched-chain amino acid ABC transporter permease [Candidatus Methylomirabilia bacterium]
MIGAYWESVLIFTGINIILALGCFFPFSAGLPSLGQAGYMAVGAYTSAVLTVHAGAPFWPAVLAGGTMAGGMGFLTGFPALRVRGLYLVIMTWGFAEMIRVFFLNFEPTGGARGLGEIAPETTVGGVYGVVAVLVVFCSRLSRSRKGRAWEAIRGDEAAAETLGISLTREKLAAFSLGAFVTGIGGGLYAHYALYIESDTFNFFRSAEILFFCVLGGGKVFWGPVVGAALLTVLPEFFRILQDWRLVFYGSTLILMMVFRPDGLIPRTLSGLRGTFLSGTSGGTTATPTLKGGTS